VAGQRAEIGEQRAESREQRAESREQRAESREQRESVLASTRHRPLERLLKLNIARGKVGHNTLACDQRGCRLSRF
jgi:hypothetical protein